MNVFYFLMFHIFKKSFVAEHYVDKFETYKMYIIFNQGIFKFSIFF